MSLLLYTARAMRLQIAAEALVSTWDVAARTVARNRDYYDGDHDQEFMTAEMRRALRLKPDDVLTQNYIPLVIDTYANRLNVATIIADNEAASGWVSTLAETNRLDLLQAAVHHATPLDAETYLMIGFDNATGQARITHEMRYDGRAGMFVIPTSDIDPTPQVAVKIWNEAVLNTGFAPAISLIGANASARGEQTRVQVRTRVNLYYSDRIEKFVSLDGKELQQYRDPTDSSWPVPIARRDGSPWGYVPVVVFRHKPRGGQGISRIENAIPLQDAINRTLSSLIIAAEKAGFPNRFALGFHPDKDGVGLEPGDWIVAARKGAMAGEQYNVKILEPGDLSQLIGTLRYLVRELGNVTATPAPELFDSDGLSGLAFQAREATLVFDCRSFITHGAATWEHAFDMAWDFQNEFGAERPPQYERFRVKYDDVKVNNRAEIVRMANETVNTGKFPTRAYLEWIGEAREWDEEDVERYLAELESDEQRRAEAAINALPDYRRIDEEAALQAGPESAADTDA